MLTNFIQFHKGMCYYHYYVIGWKYRGGPPCVQRDIDIFARLDKTYASTVLYLVAKLDRPTLTSL